MIKIVNKIQRMRAKALAAEAEQLLQSGEQIAAIDKLKQACAKNYSESSWHQKLSRLLEAEDRIGEALEENTVALDLNKTPPASWYAYRGRLFAKLDEHMEAISAYQKALSSEDATPVCHFLYISCLPGGV